MDAKEFIEAVKNADKETLLTVCQFLEVDPQLLEFPDLLSGKTHKAS